MHAAIDSLEKKVRRAIAMEYARKTSKREKTKEMTRQIFNEILKQEDCTPTTWRRIRIKVIHKKREMWKRQETTGHYALCQRFTSSFQRFCAIGCVRDSTVCNQKTRVGSGYHSRRLTLGGIGDRRAEVPGVECQNVDLDGWFS